MPVVTARWGGDWGIVLTHWVKRLIVATVVASIAAGIAGSWYELPVVEWLGLRPSALWGGSPAMPGVPALWQPFTYWLLALDPLSLVFAALAYGWFAGDLERTWGSRAFIDRFAVLVIGVATLTVFAGVIFPPIAQIVVVGPSAVLEGIVIAWGLTFPERRVRIFFFFPVTGRMLVWITVALTVLPAVFYGRDAMMWMFPLIAGVGLGFVVAKTRFSFRFVWLKLQQARLSRKISRGKPGRDRWPN